ncbi:unnamed protein product, partial [Prorocentrum cordatum]
QDLLQACPADEIVDSLKLTDIKDRTWTIQACSAMDGNGLQEGMEWLIGQCQEPQRHEEVLRLSGASFIKPPARPLLYFLVHLNVAFDLSDYPALARQAIDA